MSLQPRVNTKNIALMRIDIPREAFAAKRKRAKEKCDGVRVEVVGEGEYIDMIFSHVGNMIEYSTRSFRFSTIVFVKLAEVLIHIPRLHSGTSLVLPDKSQQWIFKL